MRVLQRITQTGKRRTRRIRGPGIVAIVATVAIVANVAIVAIVANVATVANVAIVAIVANVAIVTIVANVAIVAIVAIVAMRKATSLFLSLKISTVKSWKLLHKQTSHSICLGGTLVTPLTVVLAGWLL